MKFRDIPIWGQFLIVLIPSIAIIFVVEKYYFNSYKERIDSIKARIVKLDQEIMHGRSIEARYAEFEREVKELTEQLEKLKRILPPKKEAQDLIRKIENLAGQSDLQVMNWQQGGMNAREYYDEWPISLTVTGSYHNLAKFYEKIGNYRRIINIANVRLRALTGQNQRRTITANYTAVTYVYKE